ncbi:MAG TPA: MaoC family dehydratase N-terminal domain-containing protein [Myxococcota bacterium]|nr:MaoC family dehydratase N-terminal domain-containing protein [Myxococcota bacterium]
MADDGFVFPVDLTTIMLFASAIGETNPIYYDEEYASKTPLGGVIAPPSFASASAHWDPNYFLRGVRRIPAPKPKSAPKVPAGGQAAEARAAADGGGGGNLTRVLHGEQRFVYHQPMRPGMRLRATTRAGKSWEKQGKRGGTMRFSETITEYRDERGELVTTAISVGIVTGKAVEG